MVVTPLQMPQGRATPPIAKDSPVQSSVQGHRLTQHGRALRNLQRDVENYKGSLDKRIEFEAAVATCLLQRGWRLGVETDLKPDDPDWLHTYLTHLDVETFDHEDKMAKVRVQLWKDSFSRTNDPHMAKAYRFVNAKIAKTL